METITINIGQRDVFEEVQKATDYTGTKLADGDADVRDRILAGDEDLQTLDRFWDEAVLTVNERLKSMVVAFGSREGSYVATLEVSKAFDKTLTGSVEKTLRSFFIAFIIGEWFKFANKEEAKDYFAQGAELILTAERLLYSRKKPAVPKG